MVNLVWFLLLGVALAKPPPSNLLNKMNQDSEIVPVPYDKQAVPYSALACGAHTLTLGTYTISSPNHPGNYDNNYDCDYTLNRGSGVGTLSISCSAFNIELHSSCVWDFLSVNGANYCGTIAPSTSVAADMTIKFHADYSVVRSGYFCSITASAGSAGGSNALSCGSHTLDEGDYTITSPNHPGNYGNNFDCSYSLAPGSSVTSLTLSCSAFDIELHSSCVWDYFSVDGTKHCGTSAPTKTSSSAMSIVFHTDYSVVKPGYQCTISAQTGGVTTTTQAPSTCSCGIPNRSTRVVGGTTTEVNEYPWQAGLVSPGGTRTWCGGILINSLYVLTAAHCTAGDTASGIQVLLGDHQISVADGETRHTLSQIINHPSYGSASGTGYDFSLLKLSQPVVINNQRRPACLPTAGQTYAGATAIATGFGRTGASAPQATVLQEVELPVWSQDACRGVWGSTLKSTMICAGGRPEGGESVCMGDSGGPLVTLENGKYAAIGVVSFGRPCAVANTPDVFARVTEVLPWIQQNTAGATWCT